jgi:3-hydroxyacyl-[acyl-carrier-protein] dehydratase
VSTGREQGDGRAWEGFFLFDPEDPVYAEHFPGKPVVPGSMIIRAFLLAAEADGRFEAARRIRDFRFKKFVPPGRYRYRMEPCAAGLQCFLFDGETVAATGTIGR